jgi:hypothetical protein
LSATVLDRMIAERAWSSQAKKAADEKKRKGDLIIEKFKEDKETYTRCHDQQWHSLSAWP